MKIKQIVSVASLLLFSLVACSKEQKSAVPLQEFKTTVQGVCESCKQRIEGTLMSKPGVSTASWNKDTKEVVVNADPAQITVEKIQEYVSAVGHDAPNHKANDDVYPALPECCKYRDGQIAH